ncbi:MAG: hypothetical protein U1D55_05975 [Phycisphaerae bacterium]
MFARVSNVQFAITGILTVFAACAARGQCGEPPADSSCNPRLLSGAPGSQEVIMDVTNATTDYAMACGVNVGKSVWFRIAPAQSGTLTVSTCHPYTSFDTVVQVWRDTGDCEFPQRIDALCVDDTVTPACANGCSAFATTVTFTADAGTTYLIQVGAYNNNSAGCLLCLGLTVRLCTGDSTPPVAEIASPQPMACICGVTPVIGTANDPDSPVLDWRLESAPLGRSWSLVAAGTSSVSSGLLANWASASLTQGYYLLRLTVTNACGLSNTAVTVVFRDAAVDTVTLRTPANGAIVGGTVCLDGSAWDHCGGSFFAEYRPLGGVFQPVTSLNPPWIINDPLGSWDTRIGIPDGTYELRVRAQDGCANTASATATIVVDNTTPTAVILQPSGCTLVSGLVSIVATAVDAHLQGWVLQYTGCSTHGWNTIASGTTAVSGPIAVWDTRSLPGGAYTLRLIVRDQSVINCNAATTQQTEYLTSVRVETCPGDLNDDHLVNESDLGTLLANWLRTCP